MKAKPMSNWVVGDYKLNGKLRRNVVMKRTSRKNRFGIRVHDYFAQDNRRDWRGQIMGGYIQVKPLKMSKAFKTQFEARLRKWALQKAQQCQ